MVRASVGIRLGNGAWEQGNFHDSSAGRINDAGVKRSRMIAAREKKNARGQGVENFADKLRPNGKFGIRQRVTMRAYDFGSEQFGVAPPVHGRYQFRLAAKNFGAAQRPDDEYANITSTPLEGNDVIRARAHDFYGLIISG